MVKALSFQDKISAATQALLALSTLGTAVALPNFIGIDLYGKAIICLSIHQLAEGFALGMLGEKHLGCQEIQITLYSKFKDGVTCVVFGASASAIILTQWNSTTGFVFSLLLFLSMIIQLNYPRQKAALLLSGGNSVILKYDFITAIIQIASLTITLFLTPALSLAISALTTGAGKALLYHRAQRIANLRAQGSKPNSMPVTILALRQFGHTSFGQIDTLLVGAMYSVSGAGEYRIIKTFASIGSKAIQTLANSRRGKFVELAITSDARGTLAEARNIIGISILLSPLFPLSYLASCFLVRDLSATITGAISALILGLSLSFAAAYYFALCQLSLLNNCLHKHISTVYPLLSYVITFIVVASACQTVDMTSAPMTSGISYALAAAVSHLTITRLWRFAPNPAISPQ